MSGRCLAVVAGVAGPGPPRRAQGRDVAGSTRRGGPFRDRVPAGRALTARGDPRHPPPWTPSSSDSVGAEIETNRQRGGPSQEKEGGRKTGVKSWKRLLRDYHKQREISGRPTVYPVPTTWGPSRRPVSTRSPHDTRSLVPKSPPGQSYVTRGAKNTKVSSLHSTRQRIDGVCGRARLACHQRNSWSSAGKLKEPQEDKRERITEKVMEKGKELRRRTRVCVVQGHRTSDVSPRKG